MKNHKGETFSIRTTGTTERTQSLRKAHSMPKGVLSGSPSAAGAVRESEGGRVNAHALDDLPNIGGNHRRVTHPLLRAMHRRIDDSHDFALVET